MKISIYKRMWKKLNHEASSKKLYIRDRLSPYPLRALLKHIEEEVKEEYLGEENEESSGNVRTPKEGSGVHKG